MKRESLHTLYEDERLLVVDKPTGLCVVQPRRREAGPPLVELVSRQMGAKAYTVHRIDKGTSGVVLFAKDAGTHRALSMAFEDRRMGKTYLALVHGAMEGEGKIVAPLKDRGSGRVSVHPKGKPSGTRWKAVRREGERTLLEVSPLTGRRHQIRVHLYSVGHPVVGDPLYGEKRGEEGRMMLHAWKLRIPEGPWGGALDFTAPPPDGLSFG